MIGLEIGHTLLKAVWVGDGGAVEAAVSVPSPWAGRADPPAVPEADDVRALLPAVATLLASGPRRSGPAIVALPTRFVSVHFRDLERFSDFSEEERQYTLWRLKQSLPAGQRAASCVSYQHVSTSPTEDSRRFRLLVLVALEELINRLTDVLEEAGIDPIGFLPELFAAANLACGWLEAQSGLVSWIHVGSSGTAVALFEHGVPLLYRPCAWGTQQLVARACARLALPPDAVRTMLGDGSLTGPGSVDPVRLTALADSVVPYLQELQQTVRFHLREVGRGDLSTIVLSGGGAAALGLGPLLAEVLGAPCQTSRTVLGQTGLPEEREDSFAACLGAVRAQGGGA